MPVLVVITGAPATGKSTLARRLADDLHLPLLTKDAIKESLFDSLGSGDALWSHRLGGASFDLLAMLLETFITADVSLCLEGNFPTDRWSARLQELATLHRFSTVQIVCTASTGAILERWEKRRIRHVRHPGHLDPETMVTDEMVREWLQRHTALDIDGPVIQVDTSEPSAIDYTSILEAVRRSLNR